MRYLLLVVALGACAPSPVGHETRRATTSPSAPPPRRAFCPAGTEKVGEPPPDGLSLECVRPGGIKHGPYVYWFENGQKEEEGTYVDGRRRGRTTVWDEDGSLLKQVVYGAPVKLCAFDRHTRRAVSMISFTVIGPRLVHVSFDDSGRAWLDDLWVGTYKVEWRERSQRRYERVSKEFVVDTDNEQTVLLEVDASGYPSQFLGGPSPCAPRR